MITIGVPVYNEEKNIRGTLESILNQNYKDILVCVSDNCSTDNTYNIIEEISKRDDRVKIWRQERNIGPFDNFKFVLDKATTKYFMWVGGHDTITSTYLQEAISHLEKYNETAAVYPKAITYEGSTEVSMTDNFFVEPPTFFNKIIKIIKTCSNGSAFHSVFRTSVLKNSFLDLNGGDLYLFLRVALYGNFVQTQSNAYIMKQVKSSETNAERDLRYVKVGFKPNWREIHSMYPFTVIAEYNGLSLFKKLNLFIIVRDLMVKYRDNSWPTVTFYFLKQAKLKCSLLAFLAGIKSVIRK